MIIALSGTPGTGKTSVAQHLEGSYRMIDLTEFVRSRGLGVQGERFEVDVPEMVNALEQELDDGKDYIVEGHLAHHLPADYCVVLRCDPEVLEERLSERDYREQKIEENLESEALDLILQEAIEKQENIIEIDTTGRDAGNVAEEIEKRIEEDETGYGEIDWSEYF